MRLAVFSDLHLDATFRNLGTGGDRRRANLRQTLKRIIRQAHEEMVDALLCAGDLYEQEHSGRDTRNFLVKAFGECSMPVLIAPGNHDWYGPQSLYASAEWSPNVHVFTGDSFERFDRLAEGFTIWGAGHSRPAGTKGFFRDGFQVTGEGTHIALFHGSEQGVFHFETDRDGQAKAGHAPFNAEDIKAAGLVHAFVGHYHTPRDQKNYTYPGSPDPLSFSETGREGLVIAEVDVDGAVSRRRYDVSVSEVHDLPLDVGGFTTFDEIIERVDVLVAELAGDARITLHGELNPDVELQMDQLESRLGSLDSVFVRLGGITPGYDFDALQHEPSVRGEFVRSVLSSDLEATTRFEVLTAGLRAFNGHSLEF